MLGMCVCVCGGGGGVSRGVCGVGEGGGRAGVYGDLECRSNNTCPHARSLQVFQGFH